MAITPEGRKLTEAHRLAQLGVSKAAIQDVLSVWPLLKREDLRGTFPNFVRAVIALLRRHKQSSAQVAAAYLKLFKQAETGEAALPRTAGLVNEQQVISSLSAQTLAVYYTAIRDGHTEDRALQLALDATLGTSIRLTLQGGRDTIEEFIEDDSDALGWARVTDGDPCYFCAMLSSRGAVYHDSSEDSAGFQPHDRCGCQPEPVFRGEYHLPGRGEEFQRLWEETTGGEYGDEKRKAFRRAYESRRAEQSE